MKHIITIIALAAAAAAHASVSMDGLQLVPVYNTVRVGATVDLLWQVTDNDGNEWDQWLAVTGCREGKGYLYMVDDEGGHSEAMGWTRTSGLGEIATTMCSAAGQP